MKTVAVAGCQERIGTTTQALQLLLCLQKLEYSAAYIEMGGRGYVEGMTGVYEGIEKYPGHITYRDVDMYRGEHIIDATRNAYDYLIKDYGSITDKDFQKISFLEQDVKVVVGGVKPNEIGFVEAVLEEKCYEDVRYVFSFVAASDQQDIKALMGNAAERTYFAAYTPDPFAYKEHEIYEYLLGG